MAKSITEKEGINEPGQPEFLVAMTLLQEGQDALESGQNINKSKRRQVKAMGFNLGDMDLMRKMSEWGRDDVNEHFDRQRKYAKWYKLPVGSQSGFDFEGEEKVKPVDDEDAGDIAFAKGFQSGSLGKACEVPEQYIDQNQKWTEGWESAQKTLSAELLTKMKDSGE